MKKDTKGLISLAAGLVAFAAICALSFIAVRDMSADYRAIKDLDPSVSGRVSISYDDRMYAALGYGIETDPDNADMREELDAYVGSSLRSIDKRIVTCSLVYTMFIVTAFAYFLCRRSGDNAKKHTLYITLSALAVFAGLLGFIAAAHAVLRVPFYFPGGYDVLIIAVSFLSVVGGSCFLGWLLRLIRFKRIVCVLAIPALIALFTVGTVLESGLFAPRKIDSFDYIVEQYEPRLYDEDFDGEAYYDEEKNVMTVNGTEYPPVQVDNPDRLTGIGRIGAILFEALIPCTGFGLYAVYEIDGGLDISAAVPILYALKASAFILLSLFFRKRKKNAGQTERIYRYEEMMDEAEELLAADRRDDRLKELIASLESYYTSEEWKRDYADDEAGRLPADLKRGVLSQDGIYDLIERYKEAEDNDGTE